jgi:hypothetical protein
MSTVYVKTDGPVPEYLTAGKVYEVVPDDLPDGGVIESDDGDARNIRFSGCAHLEWCPWTLCDQHGNPVAETDWKALAGELAEAIAAHRYDVWGHGSVAHEMDERLYAALAKYNEQEKDND